MVHEPLLLFVLSYDIFENKQHGTLFFGGIWHHGLRVLPGHLKISRTEHFIFCLFVPIFLVFGKCRQTSNRGFREKQKQTKQTNKQKKYYFEKKCRSTVTSSNQIIEQLINQTIAVVDFVRYADINYAMFVTKQVSVGA